MEPAKFYNIDEIQSKITADLEVVGTEDRDHFIKAYLKSGIRKSKKLIGTHSGAFHCDEALATALLLRTNEFSNSIIVRSRDQELLDQLDLQCDVGAVFDAEKNRFDHHQKTFSHHWYTEQNEANEAMYQKLQSEGKPKEAQEIPLQHDSVTKLSSAGLIYKFFGREIIKNTCKSEWNKDLKDEEIEEIYQKIYKSLIREIDAIDNGVNVADEMVYSVNTDLSSRVGALNTPWNAPKSANYSQHSQFKKAMKICEQDFV